MEKIFKGWNGHHRIIDGTNSDTLVVFKSSSESESTNSSETVESWEHGIVVNGQKVRLYTEIDPAKIPWGEHGISAVM